MASKWKGLTNGCFQHISDKDKDTESIGSVDSSSVGIEGTPDFTLECPEKYSVQQSEDTGVHQSQTFASTPDCGSSANRSSVGNEPDFKASVDSTFEQSSSTRSENLEGSTSHQVCEKIIQIQLFNILQSKGTEFVTSAHFNYKNWVDIRTKGKTHPVYCFIINCLVNIFCLLNMA